VFEIQEEILPRQYMFDEDNESTTLKDAISTGDKGQSHNAF